MKFIKITVLEDCVHGIDLIHKGEVRLWKIVDEYQRDYMISYQGLKSFISKRELKKGIKVVQPNFSLPRGMKLKLELVEKTTFGEILISIFSFPKRILKEYKEQLKKSFEYWEKHPEELVDFMNKRGFF